MGRPVTMWLSYRLTDISESDILYCGSGSRASDAIRPEAARIDLVFWRRRGFVAPTGTPTAGDHPRRVGVLMGYSETDPEARVFLSQFIAPDSRVSWPHQSVLNINFALCRPIESKRKSQLNPEIDGKRWRKMPSEAWYRR